MSRCPDESNLTPRDREVIRRMEERLEAMEPVEPRTCEGLTCDQPARGCHQSVMQVDGGPIIWCAKHWYCLYHPPKTWLLARPEPERSELLAAREETEATIRRSVRP